MTRRHDRAVNTEGNRKHPRSSALALAVAMALTLPGTEALAQGASNPIPGIDIIVKKKPGGVWQLMQGQNGIAIPVPIDTAASLTGGILGPGEYTVSTACRQACPPHRITGTLQKPPGGGDASPPIIGILIGLLLPAQQAGGESPASFDVTIKEGPVTFGSVRSVGYWLVASDGGLADKGQGAPIEYLKGTAPRPGPPPFTDPTSKGRNGNETREAGTPAKGPMTADEKIKMSASEAQRKVKMQDMSFTRRSSGLPVPADYDGDGTSERNVRGPVAGSDLPKPIQDMFIKLSGEPASDFFSIPLEPTARTSAGAGDPQAGPANLLTELLVVIAAAAPKGGGKVGGGDSPGQPITGITISLPANPDANLQRQASGDRAGNGQTQRTVGTPIQGTEVGLEGDPGSVRVNNRVDHNGAFHFTGLPQGNFKLFIGDQPFKSVRVGPDGFIAGKVAISSDLPGERTVFIVDPKLTGTASAGGPGTVSIFDRWGNLINTRNTVGFVVNNGIVNTASGAGAADRSDTAGSRKPAGFGSGSPFGAGAGPGSGFPGMGPGPSGAGPSAPRPDMRGPMGGPSPMGPGTPRR